jgi:4-carboxymuconolactone decarboxylase
MYPVDNNEVTLGGRLPLLDPKQLEGDQKKLYELLDSTLISWADAGGFKGKTEDVKLIGPFNPNRHSIGTHRPGGN